MQAVLVTGGSSIRAPGVAAAHAARRLSRRGVVARAAEPQTKKVAEQPIEGLSSDYCDDFVCTSSPSVEASVRTLARDLQRASSSRWTPIYATCVEYSDTFRRFKGPDGYSRLDFVATSIDSPQVSITSMRMLSNAAAEIRWRLTGKLGPLPVDVAGTSEITMNLLTGRIERHIERWDLSACSPPAAALWTAARALWAAKQGSTDAAAGVDRVLDTLSMDDDSSIQQEDPNDPTKFFQQKDGSKQDMLQFAAVVGLFYILVQAWLQLFAPTSSGGGGVF